MATKRVEVPYFLGGTLGTWYPKHCVVAVLDDVTQAGVTTEELYALGLQVDDVRFFLGPEVIALSAQQRAKASPVTRLIANVTALTDEGIAEHEYRDEAAEGHSVFVVRVENHALIDSVCTVLRDHGARRIRYYDDLVMGSPGA